MRHATWTAIESSPLALGIYRSYRRLPGGARAWIRRIVTPRWHLATALVRRASNDTVLAGPFAGMKLELSPLSQRHLLGHLLGTWEVELQGLIEGIEPRGYATIINIGAADGYYAIGLARRVLGAKVIAFEANPDFHPVLRSSASANGVADRVVIRGLCTPEDLRQTLKAADGPILVVADIEGAEMDLIDPDALAELRDADILVETHDQFVPNCTDLLVSRLSASHHVERFSSRPRTRDDFPANRLPWLARLMPQTTVELMNERRQGPQHWLFLQGRRHAAHEGSERAPSAGAADRSRS
jgi:hypothetical protein